MTLKIQQSRAQRFPPGPLLRDIRDLDNPAIESETVVGIARTRVVVADYSVLQHDFPQLREPYLLTKHPELQGYRGQERQLAIRRFIDEWLLHNASFISERQANQSRVNSPVETTGERVTAHRPPRYGRAFVVLVQDGGLLELKGAGVAPSQVPSFARHETGLMFLGEALADLVLQWMIDEVFRHSGANFWTVPVYAILDAGFDQCTIDRQSFAAGLQVRRAHRRALHDYNVPENRSPEQTAMWAIEMLLRRYGITSVHPSTNFGVACNQGKLRIFYQDDDVTASYNETELEFLHRVTRAGEERVEFEGINIQLAREVDLNSSGAQLVDFGHYRALESFNNPVMMRVQEQPMLWGGACWPDEPEFVQPDPRLCLPDEQWGYGVESDRARKYKSYKWISTSARHLLCFELAERFRAGELTSDEVRKELDALIGIAKSRWAGLSV
jgi:hypothetical protein